MAKFSIQYSILIFFLLFIIATPATCQFSAGVDDTINPGVPVSLSARFGQVAKGLNITDNEVMGPLDIGFTFNFYGKPYTQFSIGENGWISFTHNPYWGATKNIRLPSMAPTSPLNCILGGMEDYNPITAGSPYVFYQTIGQAPHRRLVVMWCQCPMYGCPDALATFQIVLKEGDTIENHIFSKPVCANWDNKCTLGLQNLYGTRCDTIPNANRNSTTWSATQEGWRYVPNSSDTYVVTSIPYRLEPITPGEKIAYQWYRGSEFISDQPEFVVTPLETTTYTAHCTLCSGQAYSDEVTVHVIPYIPNAFTPNGDGHNDKFRIVGLPVENITRFNMQIFNRWGQLVFTTSDILEGWDGTRAGMACPEGMYFWVIYYEDGKKAKVSNRGALMLIH